MKAVKIKENVYWVGAIDWNLRNFHGYLTQRGSTYNSYLIIDEKITLIDNVKSYMFEEQLERIQSVIDPGKIDIIIQNHIEMDHSGSLPLILKYCPKAEIYATAKGAEGLNRHFKQDWAINVVKGGMTLSLGKRELAFVPTPMVHWPDNMVSYSAYDKILFSNDAFGQHIASQERFDHDYSLGILAEEAAKYYANIVLPYGAQVVKALNAVSGLDIEWILPSHGLIWHERINEILAMYDNWANNRTAKKALIIYDSMWGSTEMMAKMIRNTFSESGVTAEFHNLQGTHISDLMTTILDARYICLGSPTLNNNILPTMAAFLTYLQGLAPKGRIGLAFGSYGWGGQSVPILDKALDEMKFERLSPIKLKFIPDASELTAASEQLKKEIVKYTE
ncbi:MAG: FprA family A-type flavoprotein [Candidatus Cloacimonetes bacterium]|nr:FprA family A-type flavoprotein [Candidatus Cloacimonadota bacterium]